MNISKKGNIIDFYKQTSRARKGGTTSTGRGTAHRQTLDDAGASLMQSTDATKAVLAGGPITDAAILDFEFALMEGICSNRVSGVWSYAKLLNEFFRNGNKFRFINFEDYIFSYISSIHSDGHTLYLYCKNVKKGRFSPEIEEIIFSSAVKDFRMASKINEFGRRVARYIIRGRYPEYEKACKDFRYIIFLKSKGIEVDSVLMNSSVLAFLYYKNYHHLPDDVHNYMVAMSLTTDHYARNYFHVRSKDDKIIKNRLKTLDQTKTVWEVISSMTSLGK